MLQNPDLFAAEPPARDVYSVSRLNREVRVLLERGFGVLWVEGELSNFSQPASGHWYFSLKDREAQLRCTMFRMKNRAVGFTPRAGMRVLVRGRVGIYEARGDYQLNVEHLEEAGVGALQREFERLKALLAAEGLFAPARKRPLPRFPRRIGVLTSPSGAALRDVLQVLRRRFPPAQVIIYPTPVQGAAAVPGLVAALRSASQRADCDVLILTRGGGSIEDLWAFNDERVARAIHACAVPLVSGVGHEIDFTIADFVADARAPTPSAAAELVTPDAQGWLQALEGTAQRLAAGLRRELRLYGGRLGALRQRLAAGVPGALGMRVAVLTSLQQRTHAAVRAELRANAARLDATGQRLRLAHPGARLQQQMQRLDESGLRLGRAMHNALGHDRTALTALRGRLLRASPREYIAARHERCAVFAARLERGLQARMARAAHALQLAQRALDTVSPLATLGRGFAIVTAADGTLVSDARQVANGAEITARLARGELTAQVTGSKA
ncbi:MAG: exodeoxyribonuclease VII large subunit [Proteobacteria bacterium]|nr:exodeoxyribonuclease VII large subunit [Pseudomonadota bacterium]